MRSIGFIFWHTRHFAYHIGIGLLYSWVVSRSLSWIVVFGSLVPDLDHVVYFSTYGKQDWYTKKIRGLLVARQWRALWLFVERGHKIYQTNLATHNYYVMGVLLAVAVGCYRTNWLNGTLFFGSMFLHYLFDVLDDIVLVGHANANWSRLWKP